MAQLAERYDDSGDDTIARVRLQVALDTIAKSSSTPRRKTRSSSREVRIRVLVFSVVNFSRFEPSPPKKRYKGTTCWGT